MSSLKGRQKAEMEEEEISLHSPVSLMATDTGAISNCCHFLPLQEPDQLPEKPMGVCERAGEWKKCARSS